MFVLVFRLCEVTVASFMFHNESKIMKSLFISIGRFYRRSSRDICANINPRKEPPEEKENKTWQSIYQDVKRVIITHYSRYKQIFFPCNFVSYYSYIYIYIYRSASEKCLKPDGNKSCYVIFKINLKSNP